MHDTGNPRAEAMAFEARIAGEYIILRDEQPVAMLMPVDGHREALCDCLQGAGYAVAPAVEAKSLTAECTDDEPRDCELTVAVGYAGDLVRDAGIEAPELGDLVSRGYRDEGAIRRALEATRDRLTGEFRVEADEVLAATFGTTAVSPRA